MCQPRARIAACSPRVVQNRAGSRFASCLPDIFVFARRCFAAPRGLTAQTEAYLLEHYLGDDSELDPATRDWLLGALTPDTVTLNVTLVGTVLVSQRWELYTAMHLGGFDRLRMLTFGTAGSASGQAGTMEGGDRGQAGGLQFKSAVRRAGTQSQTSRASTKDDIVLAVRSPTVDLRKRFSRELACLHLHSGMPPTDPSSPQLPQSDRFISMGSPRATEHHVHEATRRVSGRLNRLAHMAAVGSSFTMDGEMGGALQPDRASSGGLLGILFSASDKGAGAVVSASVRGALEIGGSGQSLMLRQASAVDSLRGGMEHRGTLPGSPLARALRHGGNTASFVAPLLAERGPSLPRSSATSSRPGGQDTPWKGPCPARDNEVRPARLSPPPAPRACDTAASVGVAAGSALS